MQEVLVDGIYPHPHMQIPVLVLMTPDTSRALLIAAGGPEAMAILSHLHGIPYPRPKTHDVLATVVSELGGRVTHVSITTMAENVYQAFITIVAEGHKTVDIDARPSDAVALALRMGAPIYVAEELLQQHGVPGDQVAPWFAGETTFRQMEIDDEAERFRRFLDDVDPDDFLGE